ncbi:MAG: SDR family NAD(P)-dependent oxidoreductase, partial [Actinomycetota bacterium]
MTTLEGRVAFITGGARGIGRACVERLQTAGASVVFCDVDDEASRAVAASLSDRPTPVEFAQCDVTSEDEVARAMAKTVERFGTVDILVANAGIDAPFDAAAMS